jgi:hypothetical protein
LIGLLVALYPAHWRRRYGEEFRAVLESRALGPFDVADVVLGALDARLTRNRRAEATGPQGGHRKMLRIGGFGAIAGGILWFMGMAALSSDFEPDGLWIAIAILGNVGILIALVGLSAFQAHRHPRLAWAAFAIPAFGTVASVAGLLGMTIPLGIIPAIGPPDPWATWIIGLMTTLLGSVLFAVATVRARVLSRRAAVSLGVFASLTIVIGLGLFDTGEANSVGELVTAGAIAAFAASWVMLGVGALRGGPIRAIAPA